MLKKKKWEQQTTKKFLAGFVILLSVSINEKLWFITNIQSKFLMLNGSISQFSKTQLKIQ